MFSEARILPSKICRVLPTNVARPFPQLFYYPGLSSKPWHDRNDFPFIDQLESNFKEIKDEYLKNEARIKLKAKPSKEIDPMHQEKEGVCMKLPFVSGGEL